MNLEDQQAGGDEPTRQNNNNENIRRMQLFNELFPHARL